MTNNKYGVLITPDIKLQRHYFDEMVTLKGIFVGYRSLLPGKKWTTYGEVNANYKPMTTIGCLFEEHPQQETMKALGWVSELQKNASVIHVPYDTKDISVGCLFSVPSGLDNAPNRLFRCTKMSTIMIYPASISCEIVPEYEDTYVQSLNDFRSTSFNLLNQEEGYD